MSRKKQKQHRLSAAISLVMKLRDEGFIGGVILHPDGRKERARANGSHFPTMLAEDLGTTEIFRREKPVNGLPTLDVKKEPKQ